MTPPTSRARRQRQRPTTSDLRDALAGVRGLLIDLDGVFTRAGVALPGAPRSLATLEATGIPYRIVTNTSLIGRAAIARRLAGMGLAVHPERIASAASLAAALTARRHPDGPIYLIASADARREFAGQRLMTRQQADAPEASAAAVVLGDGPSALAYANLDRAFRLVQRGAELIAMHRNPWWLTERGPTLDAGAYVAGLEFATGRQAIVAGKPSPAAFQEAAREVLEEADASSPNRSAAGDLAMIGDDLDSDVAGAHEAGLRAVVVLTGKTRRSDLVTLPPGSPRRPDAVAESLADVLAALD